MKCEACKYEYTPSLETTFEEDIEGKFKELNLTQTSYDNADGIVFSNSSTIDVFACPKCGALKIKL